MVKTNLSLRCERCGKRDRPSRLHVHVTTSKTNKKSPSCYGSKVFIYRKEDGDGVFRRKVYWDTSKRASQKALLAALNKIHKRAEPILLSHKEDTKLRQAADECKNE